MTNINLDSRNLKQHNSTIMWVCVH